MSQTVLVELEEARRHRAELLCAAVADCGTLPNPEEYVREHFGGDWERAVRFAVEVIAAGKFVYQPINNPRPGPSPRETGGSPGRNG